MFHFITVVQLRSSWYLNPRCSVAIAFWSIYFSVCLICCSVPNGFRSIVYFYIPWNPHTVFCFIFGAVVGAASLSLGQSYWPCVSEVMPGGTKPLPEPVCRHSIKGVLRHSPKTFHRVCLIYQFAKWVWKHTCKITYPSIFQRPMS